jgi:hypothetical protein
MCIRFSAPQKNSWVFLPYFVFILLMEMVFGGCAYAQSVDNASQENLSSPAPSTVSQPALASAAREETAQLLEWLGVLPAIRQTPQVAEMSLRSYLLDMPASETLQALQETILQQYAAVDVLQASVIDFVAARIDARSLSRSKKLLQQSLPVAVRNTEQIMQQSSAVADMNEFHRKLGMQPVVNSRKELIGGIDKTPRMSLLAVQIQTAVDQAINKRLAAETIVTPAAENQLPQKIATRETFMQARVSNLFLFVYKDIRASELREYAILMSDDSIQKLLDLSQQAIDISVR